MDYNINVWMNAVMPDPDNTDPASRCLVQKVKRKMKTSNGMEDPDDIWAGRKKGVQFARVR